MAYGEKVVLDGVDLQVAATGCRLLGRRRQSYPPQELGVRATISTARGYGAGPGGSPWWAASGRQCRVRPAGVPLGTTGA